jgi:NADH:ubiquinone oxidoreductase subunit 4 (subunit M)
VGLSLGVLAAFLFPVCVMLVRTVSGVLSLLCVQMMVLAALFQMDLLAFVALFESGVVLLFLLIGRCGHGSLSAAYHIVLYTMAGSLVLLPVLFLAQSECGTSNLLHAGGRERQMMLGWGLLLVFLVKMPLLPLHLWLPPAHASAPTAASVLLAGVILKLGGLVGVRFMPEWLVVALPLVGCLSLLSGMLGALSTLRQVSLKPMVAYSSIVHMSVVALALMGQSELPVHSATLLMVVHGLVSPALFVLVSALRAGPVAAASFLAFTLANLSFPPTPGFWSETLCLVSVFAVHELLAIAVVVGQVLSTGYGFWAFNRAACTLSTLHRSNADQSRPEFHLVLPLLAGVLWLTTSPSL